MFEGIKKRMPGERVELVEEFDKREGFPEENTGRAIGYEEFRKILEEQKPKEVYARHVFADDLGSIGTFYMRLPDGSVIRVNSHYPSGDGQSILDSLSYKVVLYDEFPFPTGKSLSFRCKYILEG